MHRHVGWAARGDCERAFVRARVCVGGAHACAWVHGLDAGLCVPLTIRSAANAIGAILKFDFSSGRTADLRMFLRLWCEWLVVRVA